MPYTPGSDGAGIVDAVGEGAAGFKKGDRVYAPGSISGTYAEKALCTKEQVRPLLDNVDFRQGAAVGVPYATAYRAGLSNKTLNPIIGKEFPLREAARAHHILLEERAYGKIVLLPATPG